MKLSHAILLVTKEPRYLTSEKMLLFLSFIALSSCSSTVAVFNSWFSKNKPVKFSWAPGKSEESSEIDNFQNDDYYQFRWSCSAVYNKRMMVIGTMPDGADPPKVSGFKHQF